MSESGVSKDRRPKPNLSYGELPQKQPGEISELVLAAQHLEVPPQYVWKVYGTVTLPEWPIPKEFKNFPIRWIGGIPYLQGRFSFFNKPKLRTAPRSGYLRTDIPERPVVIDLSEHDALPIDPVVLDPNAYMTHAG